MFWIITDPSSGSSIQCLAKITVTVLFRPMIWTDYIHIIGRDRTITVILAKHCIKLLDDGSLDPKHVGAILNILNIL